VVGLHGSQGWGVADIPGVVVSWVRRRRRRGRRRAADAMAMNCCHPFKWTAKGSVKDEIKQGCRAEGINLEHYRILSEQSGIVS
jgi:hypothetical protein